MSTADHLREYMKSIAPHTYDMEGGGASLLDALLAEHRAEVEAVRDELARTNLSWASARDAALEEAALSVVAPGWKTRTLPEAAENIRALKSSPVSVLPVDKVREVLTAAYAERMSRPIVDAIADRLGVALDAKAEPAPTAHPPGTCRVCGAPEGEPHKMSCRPSNRDAAARRAATGRDGVAREAEPACSSAPDFECPGCDDCCANEMV